MARGKGTQWTLKQKYSALVQVCLNHKYSLTFWISQQGGQAGFVGWPYSCPLKSMKYASRYFKAEVQSVVLFINKEEKLHGCLDKLFVLPISWAWFLSILNTSNHFNILQIIELVCSQWIEWHINITLFSVHVFNKKVYHSSVYQSPRVKPVSHMLILSINIAMDGLFCPMKTTPDSPLAD